MLFINVLTGLRFRVLRVCSRLYLRFPLGPKFVGPNGQPLRLLISSPWIFGARIGLPIVVKVVPVLRAHLCRGAGDFFVLSIVLALVLRCGRGVPALEARCWFDVLSACA